MYVELIFWIIYIYSIKAKGMKCYETKIYCSNIKKIECQQK